MSLGLLWNSQGNEVKPRYPEEAGIWTLDEDDYLLFALLTDPIYCAELLGEDPANYEYDGMFIVKDYQYPLFRTDGNYAGYACARSVGKTESIKWRSVTHTFRRMGENLLLTAPELIHLLPLTDAIEDKINATRITREFLDTRQGKTGFTHRPFGVDFLDNTKIIGRIPRLTGTGVKGQHQPDLIIDEGQDYPEKGWTEVHETVLKDHVDRDGNPDFMYHFYGVHSGSRDSGFHARTTSGGFEVVQVTAMQRPGWSEEEKKAARAAYGGTSASDYKRNILGEAGGASSPFFVTARLMACVDADRESRYNTLEVVPSQFRHPDNQMCQLIRVEELDESGMLVEDALDLPTGYQEVWGGMDVGLTTAPSVIVLFARVKVGGAWRFKLIRRIHLERLRTHQLRKALYAIGYAYGGKLKGFGIDVTGLGFPIWQEMEDDEAAPQHLLDVTRDYFFNAKVPVSVDEEDVTKDSQGRMRDRFGAAVTVETDDLTGKPRYVTNMPFIEASTRYLREMVDQTYLQLPFDTEITSDMQAESQQRVARIAGMKNKPNAFHILDAMRCAAMAYRHGEVETLLHGNPQVPVLDLVG